MTEELTEHGFIYKPWDERDEEYLDYLRNPARNCEGSGRNGSASGIICAREPDYAIDPGHVTAYVRSNMTSINGDPGNGETCGISFDPEIGIRQGLKIASHMVDVALGAETANSINAPLGARIGRAIGNNPLGKVITGVSTALTTVRYGYHIMPLCPAKILDRVLGNHFDYGVQFEITKAQYDVIKKDMEKLVSGEIPVNYHLVDEHGENCASLVLEIYRKAGVDIDRILSLKEGYEKLGQAERLWRKGWRAFIPAMRPGFICAAIKGHIGDIEPVNKNAYDQETEAYLEYATNHKSPKIIYYEGESNVRSPVHNNLARIRDNLLGR